MVLPFGQGTPGNAPGNRKVSALFRPESGRFSVGICPVSVRFRLISGVLLVQLWTVLWTIRRVGGVLDGRRGNAVDSDSLRGDGGADRRPGASVLPPAHAASFSFAVPARPRVAKSRPRLKPVPGLRAASVAPGVRPVRWAGVVLCLCPADCRRPPAGLAPLRLSASLGLSAFAAALRFGCAPVCCRRPGRPPACFPVLRFAPLRRLRRGPPRPLCRCMVCWGSRDPGRGTGERGRFRFPAGRRGTGAASRRGVGARPPPLFS